jgi:teichuronic acid biosynthesis glycosyltransferase TuaC
LKVLYVVPSGPVGTASMVFAHREIERIAASGITTDTFNLRTSLRPRILFQQLRTLRSRIRQFRPDIVHAHFGTITAFATVIASRAPVIITFRGSDLNPSPSDGWLRNAVQKILSNLASRRASAVILVSQDLKSRLWFQIPNSHVIPSGIDLDRFQPQTRAEARQQLGWDLDTPVILFNAGISPAVKRLDLAEQSLDFLHETIPEAHLHVLNGTTPHDRLPLYMNASDCLLLTSDFEGSPDIIKEALACNLPIVSVDAGDVIERTEGVAGTAIVSRDPRLLAKAIASCLKTGVRSDGRAKIAALDARIVRDAVVQVYRQTLHATNIIQ